MIKRIVSLFVIIIIPLNIITAGFLLFDIDRRMELLKEKMDNSNRLSASLYDTSSLNRSIGELENEISQVRYTGIKEGDSSTIKMTKAFLGLLESNNIKVVNYSMEEAENRDELVFTAQGNMSDLLRFIYEISYSEAGYRVIFLNADVRSSGRAVTLVMRIRYA